MLLTRVLSALVLVPLVVVLIVAGGWALAAGLLAALGTAAWEYTRLMQAGGYRPTWGLTLALIAALIFDAAWLEARLAPVVMSAGLLVSLTWQLARRTPINGERGRAGTATADWALTFAGGVYLGWAGSHAIRIRAFENGAAWLLLVLAGVWLADSGAYFVGTRWGRHKMTPSLSPKKSWEGLAGGIVFGALGNALFAAALGLPALHGALLGLSGATLGALGDLSISMMKRQVGVKDSGNLIPGHGGALDRIDSLLFAVIAGHLYLAWFVGLGAA